MDQKKIAFQHSQARLVYISCFEGYQSLKIISSHPCKPNLWGELVDLSPERRITLWPLSYHWVSQLEVQKNTRYWKYISSKHISKVRWIENISSCNQGFVSAKHSTNRTLGKWFKQTLPKLFKIGDRHNLQWLCFVWRKYHWLSYVILRSHFAAWWHPKCFPLSDVCHVATKTSKAIRWSIWL